MPHIPDASRAYIRRTHPGRTTGTCTVPGVCHTPGMAFAHSQDVGAACPPSCTHPRRVEHAPDASDAFCAQNASWTRDWDMHRPRHVAHARDGFYVFPGCGGSVPTIRHVSPARGTHPRRVARVHTPCDA